MPVVILTGYHITKPHRLEHDHKIHSAVNTCSSTTAEAWQVLCDQLLLSVAFVAAFQPNLLFSISLVSNIFRGCGVAIPFTSVQIRGTLKDGSQFFNRQVFFHIVVIRLTKTLIKIRTEFLGKYLGIFLEMHRVYSRLESAIFVNTFMQHTQPRVD